jgi:hypothetical protein
MTKFLQFFLISVLKFSSAFPSLQKTKFYTCIKHEKALQPTLCEVEGTVCAMDKD